MALLHDNYNTENSKAYPFAVAGLSCFEAVFDPIQMEMSYFGRCQSRFTVEMFSASAAVGVWFLPKEGNQQVRVVDRCRVMLERLDRFVPSLQLLVYILHQVCGPGQTWNAMMHHQVIPSTLPKPHRLPMLCRGEAFVFS